MDALLQMPQQQISTTDAIWTLIVSQSKSIQKTLAKRLEAHLAEEKRMAQEKYVRKTLTSAMKEVLLFIAAFGARISWADSTKWNQPNSLYQLLMFGGQ